MLLFQLREYRVPMFEFRLECRSYRCAIVAPLR